MTTTVMSSNCGLFHYESSFAYLDFETNLLTKPGAVSVGELEFCTGIKMKNELLENRKQRGDYVQSGRDKEQKEK